MIGACTSVTAERTCTRACSLASTINPTAHGAIFQIKAVKLVEKKYIIQARARSNGNWECLAFEDQGAATNPSRYNWGNGEDWCGVGDWDGYGKEMALLNNKQAVFIFTQLSG